MRSWFWNWESIWEISVSYVVTYFFERTLHWNIQIVHHNACNNFHADVFHWKSRHSANVDVMHVVASVFLIVLVFGFKCENLKECLWNIGLNSTSDIEEKGPIHFFNADFWKIQILLVGQVCIVVQLQLKCALKQKKL